MAPLGGGAGIARPPPRVGLVFRPFCLWPWPFRIIPKGVRAYAGTNVPDDPYILSDLRTFVLSYFRTR